MHPELTHVFTELVIVLGGAALAALVFQLLRLPLVLGYIVAGLVLGPHVTAAVSDASLVDTLSDLGVILLFFTIGLEFSIRTIARVGLPTLLTVVAELGLVIFLMWGGGRAFGWTGTEAMFVAVGVAIASTMLVVKGLEDHAATGPAVELILAMMVVEDLLSILLLAAMTGVAAGSGVSAGELAGTLARLGGVLVAMIGIGLLVVPRAIRAVARFERSEPLMVASLAICFALVWVAVQAGYSLALGAFAAGMLIAESGKGHEVDKLVRPFRDIFAAIFFIAIGMTIVPAEIADHWVAAVCIAALLVVGKTLAVTLAAFLTGNGLGRSVQAGLSLSQIGEFAFIVLGVGISAGVVRGFLLPVVVGASCITAITGTWQIRASDRFASWLAAHLPHSVQTFVSFYEAWIAKLRTTARPETSWSRLRRPTIMLLIDTVMLGVVAIGAGELHGEVVARIVQWTELDERVVLAGFAIAAAAVAGLFALGLARGAGRLAWLLATATIPHAPGGAPDLGHSPRRALVLTLELAIVLVLGVPLAVVVQPVIPAGGLIVIVLVVVLAIATRRSITDFDEHVRAGSSLIVEVLGRQTANEGPPGLAEAQALLPGFEGLTPIALPAGSSAVGKSLAELDLRAATGASVLAIGRAGGGTATPSPTEPLLAGDVLALAGSTDAIAAARALLES